MFVHENFNRLREDERMIGRKDDDRWRRSGSPKPYANGFSHVAARLIINSNGQGKALQGWDNTVLLRAHDDDDIGDLSGEKRFKAMSDDGIVTKLEKLLCPTHSAGRARRKQQGPDGQFHALSFFG